MPLSPLFKRSTINHHPSRYCLLNPLSAFGLRATLVKNSTISRAWPHSGPRVSTQSNPKGGWIRRLVCPSIARLTPLQMFAILSIMRTGSVKPIEPVYRQFGSKVEAVRTTLGLTQLELAKKVGLGRPSIANIEAGNQRVLLADVNRFADAFGISPKALMRGIWL